MRPTPRFRFFRRVATDEETGDARAPPRAVRAARGRPTVRSWIRPLPSSPRRYLGVVLLLAAWVAIFVGFQLFHLPETRAPSTWKSPQATRGPNSIRSEILTEQHPRSRENDAQRPGGDQGAGAGRACRNTVQGASLLADSEGRVCTRSHVDVSRPGCCASGPLGEPGLPSVRVLSAKGMSSGEDNLDQHAELILAPRGMAGEAADDEPGPPEWQNAAALPPADAMAEPFSCWSCEPESSCCLLYEFCVSCCMNPARDGERAAIHAAVAHPAYSPEGSASGALPSKAFDHCAYRCRTYSGSVAHENSYRGPFKHCFGRYRPPMAPGMSPNSDGSRLAELALPKGSSTGLAGDAGDSPGSGKRPLELDPYLSTVAALP